MESRAKLKYAVALILVFVWLCAGCAVMPQRLTPDEVAETVRQDQRAIEAGQEPISGVLTLYDAMARAVAYNLDHRTRMMEQALAMGQLDLANADMLPRMAATAGYTWRSEEDASYSRGYWDRILSRQPSLSDDPSHVTANLGFSWSILDFGLSYYLAKQQADRFLIAQNSRMKLVQRLMHQTRVAYVKAQAAQEMGPAVRKILADVREALAYLDKIQAERLQPPLATLQSRRALLELMGQLESVEQSLVRAEVELKSLINVRPGQELILERPASADNPPMFQANLDDLELVALQNSLDISEQLYNTRIEQVETRKALLRLLPDLNLRLGINYDDNAYLMNQNWYDAGASVTWNLLRLTSLKDVQALSQTRENLTTVRRMALNMAVVTRLHLAWRQYGDAMNQLARARQLDELEGEIARHTQAGVKADVSSRIERIRNDAGALRARMRRHENEAAVQDALGAFITSLGIDVSGNPETDRLAALAEMENRVADQMRRIEEGILPEPYLPKADKTR